MTVFLVVMLVAVSIAAAYFARETQRLKRRGTVAAASASIIPTTNPDAYEVLDMSVVDHSGAVLMKVEEMASMPLSTRRIDQSDEQIGKIAQLASDLVSGSARLPGKTIRLVFKPEIAQGLKDGTYTLMKSKSGEVFADAVQVASGGANQIVGKGRIVQSGQASQIAGGAFMLLSIAVAQAHLADIERSLGSINRTLYNIQQHMESQDISKIAGALNYLKDMLPYLRDLADPNSISSEKSHEIESIIRESFEWIALVQRDLNDLVSSISNISSKDTLGTRYTYNEIMDQVRKLEPLVARYEMYLQLAAVAHTIVSYLDPMNKRYSRPRILSEEWLPSINAFKEAVSHKVKELISHSYVNTDELISFRSENVIRTAGEINFNAYSVSQKYSDAISRLDVFIQGMLTKAGDMQLAVRYDDSGQVQDAAFLTH